MRKDISALAMSGMEGIEARSLAGFNGLHHMACTVIFDYRYALSAARGPRAAASPESGPQLPGDPGLGFDRRLWELRAVALVSFVLMSSKQWIF
jgi:hypothetical protein